MTEIFQFLLHLTKGNRDAITHIESCGMVIVTRANRDQGVILSWPKCALSPYQYFHLVGPLPSILSQPALLKDLKTFSTRQHTPE